MAFVSFFSIHVYIFHFEFMFHDFKWRNVEKATIVIQFESKQIKQERVLRLYERVDMSESNII